MTEKELFQKLLAVTDRKLCVRPFPEQIRRVCSRHPRALILREKDLAESEYEKLAEEMMEICAAYEVPCILHAHPETAMRLGCGAIHLPLPVLETYRDFQIKEKGMGDIRPEHRKPDDLPVGRDTPAENGHLLSVFEVIGVSVHSVSEAKRAQELGADYLTAGHIFATGCKPGLPPRGLSFLREVTAAVSIPVYGIGGIGIDEAQVKELIDCGAAGGAVMSGMMRL